MFPCRKCKIATSQKFGGCLWILSSLIILFILLFNSFPCFVNVPLGRVADPGGAHLDPLGRVADPGGAHLDPLGRVADPGGAHLDPTLQRKNGS